MGKTARTKYSIAAAADTRPAAIKRLLSLGVKGGYQDVPAVYARKSGKYLNVVLDNTPNAIVILDSDFNLMEYNKAQRNCST